MDKGTLLSTFGNKTYNDIKQEITSLYLNNNTPWVIGYSGGKDSTAVVQFIYLALLDIPTEQRQKKVYVLSSDTKVETPAIVNHIDINLKLIQDQATRDDIPIETVKVMPNTSSTFWVNLIGRGYPAPTNNFRWCTDRMKIQPANNFISQQVSKYGEIIMVLGVRSDESISRANTMKKNQNKYDPESLLSRHGTLSGALVYSPIKDFSTDDVWTFLLQYDSPWGFDNNQLLSLYRSANAGECPLVIDNTTASCGNSRFGCWTCTVVTKDKALEAMVENGEDWLEPLIDYRDLLASTQTPEGKKEFRRHKRRTGAVNFIARKVKVHGKSVREDEYESVELSYGPYKFDYMKEFLEKLLETQKKVNDANPNKNKKDSYFELISIAELEEIRKLWKIEQQNWNDDVPKIFEEVMEKPYPLKNIKGGGFVGSDFELLKDICEEYSEPVGLVAKLLDTARSYDGLKKRTNALKNLESIIKEEWRAPEEILQDRKQTVQQRKEKR